MVELRKIDRHSLRQWQGSFNLLRTGWARAERRNQEQEYSNPRKHVARE
jgi:hypothetical protein